jgi:hypothetical protein
MTTNETQGEELKEKTLEACIRVLSERPMHRLDAIPCVGNAAWLDIGTTERFMDKLVEEGLLNYENEVYSLR